MVINAKAVAQLHAGLDQDWKRMERAFPFLRDVVVNNRYPDSHEVREALTALVFGLVYDEILARIADRAKLEE